MAESGRVAKSLKGADGFQKAFASGVTWVSENQSVVLGALGGLLIVFLGIFGWQYWKNKQTTDRQDALAAIDYQYNKEVEAVETQKAELNKKIAEPTKLPGMPAVASSLPKAEKDAIQKEIDALKPDHSKSMESYKNYFDKNSTTNEGMLAGMRYAGYLLSLGKVAEAKPILESVLEKSKTSDFHQIHAGFMYTNVLVEEKDYDRALQQVEQILSKASDDIKPQVHMLRAKILIVKGDKDSANKALETLIKDFATSAEAQKAKGMKAVLLN